MFKFMLIAILFLVYSQTATSSPRKGRCKTTLRKVIGQGRTCGCSVISSSCSLRRCKRECIRDENCVAFTYDNGICYTCNTTGGTTSSKYSEHFMLKRCEPCTKWHTINDFEVVGHCSKGASTLEKCQRRCDRKGKCAGVNVKTSPFECTRIKSPVVQLRPANGTDTYLITRCEEKEFIYTIENQLEGETDIFKFSITVPTLDFGSYATFLDVMFTAEEISRFFRFVDIDDPAHGTYITTINGIEQDLVNEKFWAFLLRDAQGDCLMPVGVSNYFPAAGEQVVLSYKTYDVFNELPYCWVTGPKDEFGITYTIENGLEDFPPTFNHTIPLQMCVGENFFVGMEKAAAIDENFRFNSTFYEGLGEFITDVNGLASNVTTETFWSFRSRNATEDCLMPVGVSSYIPSEGEHIVLSYSTYDIFNVLPQCDGGDSGHDDI